MSRSFSTQPGFGIPRQGYMNRMIKSLMFIGGVVAGFAVASGMTDEQRRNVRTKAQSVTKGERSQRLASVVTNTTESVADAAVAKVETAADKVVSKVDPSHDSHDSNGMYVPTSPLPLGVV